jgi:hypothetical protein
MGTPVPKRLNNICFRGDRLFLCQDSQDLMPAYACPHADRHPVPFIMLKDFLERLTELCGADALRVLID